VGGGGGSGDGGAAGAEVVERVRPRRPLVSGARPHRGSSSDSLKERNRTPAKGGNGDGGEADPREKGSSSGIMNLKRR